MTPVMFHATPFRLAARRRLITLRHTFADFISLRHDYFSRLRLLHLIIAATPR
jgi:hypothetical protein